MRLTVINNGITKNNGVMAMAVALADELNRLRPDYELEIVLHYPYTAAKDRDRFARCGLRTVDSSMGNLFYRYGRIFPVLGPLYFAGLLLSRGRGDSTFRPHTSDALISLCGEDFFSDNWGIGITLLTWLHCVSAFITRKPLVVLAQTFGPFQRGWSRRLARQCLGRAALVTARDPVSYNLVRALVGHDRVALTSDLAFLLQPAPLEAVLERYPELRTLAGEGFIGVSASDLFGYSVFHSIKARGERLLCFRRAMADLLDYTVDRYGLPVVFVPHVTLDHSDDRAAAREVVALMRHPEAVTLLEQEYTAPEIKTVIGWARAFIGCRMHALIGAVSQAVPTLALAYSPKTVDVIGGRLGYPFVVDLRDADPATAATVMAACLDALLADPEAVRQELYQAVQERMVPEARRNVELLVAALEAHNTPPTPQ